MDTFTFQLFLIPIILVVSFSSIYAIFLYRAGPAARHIANLRRKARAVILRLTPENTWAFIPVLRKIGNVWYHDEGSVIVTAEHVKPTVGLPPAIIEHSIFDYPNESFAYYASMLASQTSGKKNTKLPTFSDVMTYLIKRESAIKDIIDAHTSIKEGASTLETETKKLAQKRGIADDEQIARLKERLSYYVSDGITSLKEELKKIQEAMNITLSERRFEVELDDDGKVSDVKSIEVLDIDDFISLTPIGTVQDVQTLAQRNEAVALKESEFTMPQAMKYLTLGVVIFIILTALAFFLRR